MALLHTEGAHGSFSDMGAKEIFHALWDEVILHALLDTLKIIVFLFLAYLVMEFIEHKASSKIENFVKKAGALGPLAGGFLGLIPQCGFSAVASNFYTARVITMGTLLSVFISTSDEMLPIMISGNVPFSLTAAILGYKLFAGVLTGFIIDLVLRLMRRGEKEINIDEICENDNCHCERGILFSALHHTLTVGGFVLLITLVINALVFFIGSENISAVMQAKGALSYIVAALFGLIPNCAASVALTSFFMEGFISVGTMVSGLCSGAGVGLIVLLRVNKRKKENAVIVGILVLSGIIFGAVLDLFNLPALLV